MAEFYVMPSVSPTMELGTLVAWQVAEGGSFAPQTVLAEVGTDKANMDAEIFDSGVMIKHLVAEGDEVPPGFPIAIVGESADEEIGDLLAEFEARKAAQSTDAAKTDADAAQPDADAAKPDPDPDAKPAAAPAAPAPPTGEAPSIARSWMGRELSTSFADPTGDLRAATRAPRIAASPLARKVAADKGVNLTAVSGSGPGGRIVRADVEAAAIAPATAPAPAPSGRADEVVRNSPMRKTIAKRLLASHQDIPTFFLTVSFDVGGFVALRQELKARAPDAKVSYNDMFLGAVARALRDFPRANASWSDTQIVRHGNVDIGVAVALPDGLITPVIRNADRKGLADVAGEVRELAGRARDGKLAAEDYQGNTFTISNLGMFGIEEFTAIINPPASAILAVGAIAQVPVVTDGELTTGWRMRVTMTCDHRVIDGATGAEFLSVLRRYVEAPALMLL